MEETSRSVPQLRCLAVGVVSIITHSGERWTYAMTRTCLHTTSLLQNNNTAYRHVGYSVLRSLARSAIGHSCGVLHRLSRGLSQR